ncbi:MAG: TetR/AcrR family transcriptional regulator [Gammaproteobacteria bacterium]
MAPKRGDADKELKRERLVTAAAQVFAARGYRNATMDEIAQAAGTAKGTLYLYFKDKEALFYAAFEWLTAQTLGHYSGADNEEASASARLYALAEAAARFMAENREWFPLTLEVWAAGGSTQSRERFATALREMYAQYRAVIAAIIRTGQNRGELRADLDADALGAVLTGAMDGLLLQCWFDASLDPLPLLQGLFDPLLRGMQADNHRDKS